MKNIQNLSDKKLWNLRADAGKGLRFGMTENWDCVDSCDKELLKRGLIKQSTREKIKDNPSQVIFGKI